MSEQVLTASRRLAIVADAELVVKRMDATLKKVKKPKAPKRPKPWRVVQNAASAKSSTAKAARAALEGRPDYEHGDDNLKVVLTCIPPSERAMLAACIPTSDAHDRAHGKRDATGQYLLPAARGGRVVRELHSKARCYHKSQMTSRGVGVDSMFDGWWEVYSELCRAGIPLGGIRYSRQEIDAFRESLYMPSDLKSRPRDVLHQVARQDQMTSEELKLERMASALLRRARAEKLAEAGEDQ